MAHCCPAIGGSRYFFVVVYLFRNYNDVTLYSNNEWENGTVFKFYEKDTS